MCWVLAGGLRCASVRVQCACACNVRVRLRECSYVCLCPFARARARVYACLCERMCGFVRFHRITIPRVCVDGVVGGVLREVIQGYYGVLRVLYGGTAGVLGGNRGY